MVSSFLFPFYSYISQVIIKLIFIIKYTVFVHIKACHGLSSYSLGVLGESTVHCMGWSIQDKGHSGSDCICYSSTSCHAPSKYDEYYSVIEENEDLLILAYAIPYCQYCCSNC